jgi:uncharacterized protein (DUF1697 family)
MPPLVNADSKRGCHLAFLRALNVRGHASMRLPDLIAAFEAAGCTEVRSYIQGGNIAFRPPGGQLAAVFASVRVELRRVIGETPVVLFRSARALADLIGVQPFGAVGEDPASKPYVVFLSRRPFRPIEVPFASEDGRLSVVSTTGREVFVVSRRNANGSFAVPNPFVESALGVPAASRSWATITKLVELTREYDVHRV